MQAFIQLVKNIFLCALLCVTQVHFVRADAQVAPVDMIAQVNWDPQSALCQMKFQGGVHPFGVRIQKIKVEDSQTEAGSVLGLIVQNHVIYQVHFKDDPKNVSKIPLLEIYKSRGKDLKFMLRLTPSGVILDQKHHKIAHLLVGVDDHQQTTYTVREISNGSDESATLAFGKVLEAEANPEFHIEGKDLYFPLLVARWIYESSFFNLLSVYTGPASGRYLGSRGMKKSVMQSSSSSLIGWTAAGIGTLGAIGASVYSGTEGDVATIAQGVKKDAQRMIHHVGELSQSKSLSKSHAGLLLNLLEDLEKNYPSMCRDLQLNDDFNAAASVLERVYERESKTDLVDLSEITSVMEKLKKLGDMGGLLMQKLNRLVQVLSSGSDHIRAGEIQRCSGAIEAILHDFNGNVSTQQTNVRKQVDEGQKYSWKKEYAEERIRTIISQHPIDSDGLDSGLLVD